MKAKLNGSELYYEVHGKEGAPWLVLSHSLACSARMWDPQIEAFKDRWRILAYDMRGHGASAAPQGPYTLDMLAEIRTPGVVRKTLERVLEKFG